MVGAHLDEESGVRVPKERTHLFLFARVEVVHTALNLVRHRRLYRNGPKPADKAGDTAAVNRLCARAPPDGCGLRCLAWFHGEILRRLALLPTDHMAVPLTGP
jgi:hypothetical protein